MKHEREKMYHDLLEQFQEECLFLKTGDINSRGRLLERVDDLLERDPYFEERYFAMLDQHRQHWVNLKIARHVTSKLLIEELHTFAHGKPVDFTDANLRMLMSCFNDEFKSRSTICEDAELHQAFLHWQAEYQRRFTHDDHFALDVLLGKLLTFTPGYPYSEELAGEILELLDRLYGKPIFQETLHRVDKKIHKALAYWLEERQRRIDQSGRWEPRN